MIVYLLAAEYITADSHRGETFLFRRKDRYSVRVGKLKEDEEAGQRNILSSAFTATKEEQNSETEEKTINAPEQGNVTHWRDLCYDIPVKGGVRRITDHVDGWVKPGMLTALMVRNVARF